MKYKIFALAFVATLFGVIVYGSEVMQLKKAIDGVEPDLSYLKSIYEDNKLDSSLRFTAAGVLYEITDKLEYLTYQCKTKPKLLAGTFGRMRNDHYDDVLIRAISGAIVEMPPLKASGYAPSPYTDFLTVDFVSTCKALKNQGVKDYYTNLLFKLIPHFKQQRKLDVVKVARDLYPVSDKIAIQFVAALMDAGMGEEVLAIKKLSNEYEKLINDIAQKRMKAYSIYSNALGISSGQSVGSDSQETK